MGGAVCVEAGGGVGTRREEVEVMHPSCRGASSPKPGVCSGGALHSP